MDFPRLTHLYTLPKQYPAYDFSNTVLVAIQHLLGTNGTLLELLDNLGLPYEQMYVLGKVYSTNEDVYHELKRRGAYVHRDSMRLGKAQLTIDYKVALRRAANQLVEKALARLAKLQGSKTLLVVDDGGVLVDCVNRRSHDITAQIVGVEQTRSGANALRAIPRLTFPVINVAESSAKLQDESPFIAASIVKSITRKMPHLPQGKSLRDCNALVVGYGAVGKNVAIQLKPLVRSIEIYDIVSTPGVSVITNLKLALKGKDLIVGCVGSSWLPNRCHELLPAGVVLASGSSSNSEFLGIEINHRQSVNHQLLGNQAIDCAHADYAFANGRGWVLNAGFPVNFSGEVHAVDPVEIELTRVLMLSGILQALTVETKPGLQKLEVKFRLPNASHNSSASKSHLSSSRV